ncbi:hypothetical protein Xets_03953 [Xenorhabdus sp. TS4]|nr:hypothetical protein [Xenorhabdus sp. TS4]
MALLGEYIRASGVLQNKLHPLRWIFGGNGHISATSFQYRQDADNHCQTAVKIEGDGDVCLQGDSITLLITFTNNTG